MPFAVVRGIGSDQIGPGHVRLVRTMVVEHDSHRQQCWSSLTRRNDLRHAHLVRSVQVHRVQVGEGRDGLFTRQGEFVRDVARAILHAELHEFDCREALREANIASSALSSRVGTTVRFLMDVFIRGASMSACTSEVDHVERSRANCIPTGRMAGRSGPRIRSADWPWRLRGGPFC